MNRRHALAFLTTIALPLQAIAQSSKVRRIGVVFSRVPVKDLAGVKPAFAGARILREDLKALGWEDGKNIELIWRSLEGDAARAPKVIQELVDAKVDLIAVSGSGLVAAAREKTKTIPIVMINSVSPVESGFVASMSRPGANVTGLAQASDLTPKRLGILRQIVPKATRVAHLSERGDRSLESDATREAARSLGMTILPYIVETEAQMDVAMRDAMKRGANAVFVQSSFGAATSEYPALARLTTEYKLPALFRMSNAINGGLVSYGSEDSYLYKRSAVFIDKIFRGADPGSLAIETPSNFYLVINLKTAKALGITIPESLLAQATRVIQ